MRSAIAPHIMSGLFRSCPRARRAMQPQPVRQERQRTAAGNIVFERPFGTTSFEPSTRLVKLHPPRLAARMRSRSADLPLQGRVKPRHLPIRSVAQSLRWPPPLEGGSTPSECEAAGRGEQSCEARRQTLSPEAWPLLGANVASNLHSVQRSARQCAGSRKAFQTPLNLARFQCFARQTGTRPKARLGGKNPPGRKS
jgi:hypothetical protein